MSLIKIDPIKEQEKIARLERNLIVKLRISYSDLQSIPMRVINIWCKQEFEDEQKRQFEIMKVKNARSN